MTGVQTCALPICVSVCVRVCACAETHLQEKSLPAPSDGICHPAPSTSGQRESPPAPEARSEVMRPGQRSWSRPGLQHPGHHSPERHALPVSRQPNSSRITQHRNAHNSALSLSLPPTQTPLSERHKNTQFTSFTLPPHKSLGATHTHAHKIGRAHV